MSQIQGYRPGGGGTGFLQTLTGNTGGAVPPTGNNIDVVGAGGVTVTGNPGTSTLTITVSGALSWTEVTGTSQAMAVNHGYIANNAGLVTFTLPTVSAVGSIIKVVGKGAGGWSITYTTNQQIHFGAVDTTLTTGSLSSSQRYDGVELVCTVADLIWTVSVGPQGNLTYV